MEVDYLVIGQGICGTLLSRDLLKAGSTVMVIDEGKTRSSSKAAGGIINPVTGKRLVRSWMIEELQPFAWEVFKSFEADFGVQVIRQCDILDFHFTQEMSSMFHDKLEDEKEYLSTADSNSYTQYFRFNYGVGIVAPGMLVDMRSLLGAWGSFLKTNNAIRNEQFILDNCTITNDLVTYGDVRAKKVIFCDGASGAQNPYFDVLPWSKDKGEALIVSIPGLPVHNIYKQGNISIVPWQDDLFWIGAAHDWKFTDMEPTATFRNKTVDQLKYWLKLPFTVVDHLVAQRPSNVERRPFVGLHPVHSSVGIFNGMGSKGCSVAPYFSHQFAKHLAHGQPILPAVDVKRFTKVLSRTV